ncbi:Major Facilitator Superfamily protein [Streptomyces sp. NP10]|uniref:MFS transporter n=1 Tax=Streptomyces sp. NP10 TaxID=1141731 RepID=UPI000F8936A2|nr:MFS transporter [Streptomyces sp. NP10]RUP69650.1 Major Facilitator Superfamily protein [Streptomyces sp. NP10]
MRTYRELFRTPEFTPFFAAVSVQTAAQTATGLALGTLVYARTGSPLLSALAMFGPSLAQVAGALTLLSAADRLPPRSALTALALLSAGAACVQAVPGLPLWAAFAVLLVMGVAASPGGGVRYGLLNEIVPREGFLLGRSVLNMTGGAMQICGFAVGGALVAVFSARGTLLVGAALYVVAAAVTRLGLTARPPRATGRPSIGETWRTNALLWSATPRRYVFLALWVPNGLVVGCESLYVAYAPGHAGLLFACGALGMLAGDTLVGRFVAARWRARLGAPLRLLLAAPYLLFALRPGLPVALAVVVVASVGFAASLLLQERLLALTPQELSGHALGLSSSGMLAMQGVGAAVAGGIAQVSSPATGMAAVAGLSVAVTLALAPGLRAPVDADGGRLLGADGSPSPRASRTPRTAHPAPEETT